MRASSSRGLLAILLLVASSAVPSARAYASTRIAGYVWTIDRDGARVTIIDAGHRLTFSYTPDTIIRSGSSDRTIADLRRGDRVVVTLAEETPDEPRARVIAIAGTPAPSGKLDVFR